ncbi:LysR substrate-binding domain-containing protein [Ferrimonas balearica]|uniref:LysR substrate-binding domain-containing protein n=1 Tax=Ferrimonas balearica TaxID=44012 RepID=UPI001C9A06BC|nr:LysR substrate-binding domain-containing protein [Ferrimonas balearica]MBY5990816.1 LysR family transcriptional regulator [Ferrimonas balearica]
MKGSWRRVDLNLLTVFNILMQEQNLTHTARVLSMTQPAVSQALNRLRSLYDDALFVRSGRGMVPTAKAHQIYPFVKQALAQVALTLPNAGEFDAESAMEIFNLNAFSYVGQAMVPELMARFREHAPHSQLALTNRYDLDPVELLSSRQADLHLDYLRLGDANLHQERLYSERLVMVCRQDHPRLRQPEDITEAAFFAEHHAVMLPRDSKRYPMEDALAMRLKHRKVAFSSADILSIVMACANSDLVAGAPESLARRVAEVQPLAYYPMPFELSPVDVYLYWHNSTESSAAHRWLRQWLMAQFDRFR